MMNSDLSARLKNLLLVDQSTSEPPQKNDTLPMQRRKPLEEISSKQHPSKSQETPALSLAEQMMAASASVQKNQKEKQRNEQQKKAKNATFGLKKGFLMKDKPRKKAISRNKMSDSKEFNTDTRNSAIQKQRSNLIVELDSKDNTASPNHSSQDATSNPNPLYLPEVQDSLSSHLQSDQTKWASQSFLASLSQHPTLSKGWNDPRYMAALESMKTHPKETMEKLKADEPEILHWLMEFLSVMGDHFVMLGENDDNSAEEGKEKDEVLEKEPKKLLREMGPLEEKAMRRSPKAQPTSDQKQQDKSNSMDNEVNKILSNDTLRSILLDPKMQQVMEECASDGGGTEKLRYYMMHDEFGPKLRVLMKAGLLKIA